MLLKNRTESEELLTMRYLNARMELVERQKFRYLNMEKGYEGELQFDLLAENIQEDCFIINDLLLEVNNSYFQIDTIIISQAGLHLLDIKNYQGDCYFESDKLFNASTKREYKNPVVQLKRSESLLRQLLHDHKQSFLVDSAVIFINPEFTLYQAPMDQPFVLPTQINRFIHHFNQAPSKLHDGHRRLAQTLISLHQTKNPFSTIPEYRYGELRKGIYCKTCGSFRLIAKNQNLICEDCHGIERIEQGVLRNVKEFSLLFPNKRITTSIIYDWCRLNINRRTLRRILKKNFSSNGKTSETYYERKK